MKFSKYIVLGVILFVLFIFYKKHYLDCAGCGGCSYVKFEDQVQIKSAQYKNDTLVEVLFSSIIDSTQFNYHINSWDIYERFTNLDPNLYSNKKTTFHISGEKITSGSCAPYFIKKIEVVKTE